MTGTQDWSDIFAPHGHILHEGEIIRRRNLSRTLDIIAREGAKGFYEVRGPVYVVADFWYYLVSRVLLRMQSWTRFGKPAGFLHTKTCEITLLSSDPLNKARICRGRCIPHTPLRPVQSFCTCLTSWSITTFLKKA